MTKFIRSTNGKFLVNVSKIHRIYKVENPIFLNIAVDLFKSGQETGIHCDISGKGKMPPSIPLATLSEIKWLVKMHHSRIRTEQFIKELSSSLNVSRLIDLMMDQVEQSLSNNENVIDMSVVVELAIARLWRSLNLYDHFSDVVGTASHGESEQCL